MQPTECTTRYPLEAVLKNFFYYYYYYPHIGRRDNKTRRNNMNNTYKFRTIYITYIFSITALLKQNDEFVYLEWRVYPSKVAYPYKALAGLLACRSHRCISLSLSPYLEYVAIERKEIRKETFIKTNFISPFCMQTPQEQRQTPGAAPEKKCAVIDQRNISL